MGGNFTSIQGIGRDYVVRIFATAPPRVNGLLRIGDGSFRLSATASPGAMYVVERSQNVADGWVEFTRGTTADGSISVDVSTTEEMTFFRIVQP
jgi:hypothetical protein